MSDGNCERPMGPAIRHGLRCKCPSCGEGRILERYLSVRPECPSCGEPYFHHRADDGPAYLTILLVGHLMAPLILIVFTQFRPDPLTLALAFSTGCIAFSLFLLPRLKGMIIAIQWSRRMHGFA